MLLLENESPVDGLKIKPFSLVAIFFLSFITGFNQVYPATRFSVYPGLNYNLNFQLLYRFYYPCADETGNCIDKRVC